MTTWGDESTAITATCIRVPVMRAHAESINLSLDKPLTEDEARALLTPDRMERLIALERHFKGGKLRGIFEDGHMTLALEAPDQFEAGSIFQPLVDPTRFTTALTELGLVCDLIDGFLTRDWVKSRL